MAHIVWDDVTALATDLGDVDLDAQANILEHVNSALRVSDFGGEEAPALRLTRIYLAAHHGVLAKSGSQGPTGPVTSETVGEVSRAYASFSPTGSDALYDITIWGKMFRAMLRRSPARAFVLG